MESCVSSLPFGDALSYYEIDFVGVFRCEDYLLPVCNLRQNKCTHQRPFAHRLWLYKSRCECFQPFGDQDFNTILSVFCVVGAQSLRRQLAVSYNIMTLPSRYSLYFCFTSTLPHSRLTVYVGYNILSFQHVEAFLRIFF